FIIGSVLFYLLNFPHVLCSFVEIHSLEYIYTALSKPIGLPGIYEFTAMGILDDKEIDYYNSQEKLKIPRQNWMKERLNRNYWNRGTQSRRSKEQWFKVSINILMDRMRHNNSDVHALQCRIGCRGVHQPDGSLRFLGSTYSYGYDGEDFLSFDDSNSQWIASVPAALPSKRKRDKFQILNQYTKGYLQKECMDCLSKFMYYGEADLRKHCEKSKISGKVFLHCLATGLHLKDVKLDLYRNGVVMTESDGLMSTGIRPNGLNPDQLRKSIEVSLSDNSVYKCEVDHRILKEPIIIVLGIILIFVLKPD
uniref:Ig-like domain-containing protein n=1 Tax=Scleropages formosus TaxID=113540 RepID=A0A8C9SA63_SCLFO